MDCSPLGSSVRGDSPRKNSGAGCHALLQYIINRMTYNDASDETAVLRGTYY